MTYPPPTENTQAARPEKAPEPTKSNHVEARPDKVAAPTKREQAEAIKANFVIEAPSFSLGYDAVDTCKEIDERGRKNLDCDKDKEEDATGKDEDNSGWDIDWDNEELKVCLELADEKALAQQTLKGEYTSTPVKPATPHIDLSSPRGSTPIQRGHERRPVKLPPFKRSPFVNYGSKLAWVCLKETNEVYDVVLLLGRSNARDKGPDNR